MPPICSTYPLMLILLRERRRDRLLHQASTAAAHGTSKWEMV